MVVLVHSWLNFGLSLIVTNLMEPRAKSGKTTVITTAVAEVKIDEKTCDTKKA